MEQEFTTSSGYKICYGAIAFGLIIFSGYLLINTKLNPNGAGIFMSAILLVIASGIIFNLFKRKVIFSENTVIYVSIWGSKELFNIDIKGFRVGEKAIFIEPLQQGYSKIKIRDYDSVGANNDLVEWLTCHFKDLNKEEFEGEKAEILQDLDLGQTAEDRESMFKSIGKYTMAYSFVGLALFLITLFLHESNLFLSMVSLIYPLSGLVLMGFSKGLIRLYAKKNSAYPSIFIGLLLSSIVTVLQSLLDKEILNYDNFWVPSITIFMILFFILYYLAIKIAKASFLNQVFFIVIISALYGFGSTLLANFTFDQSKPQVFSTTVTSRQISHGKSTSYHIIIGEWGQQHEEKSISVSKSFYYQVAVGSTVKVNLKKGLFNIPWYYLQK
jgi:hypothetical protein